MYFLKEFEINDYTNEYNDLLKQLTLSTYDKKKFLESYKNVSLNKKIYLLKNDYDEILATGTIILEQKFSHNFSKVGHIEDIIVKKTQRGNGLGKLMVNFLIKIAKNNNCYKIILNCSEKYKEFYKKCGFSSKNIEMSLYLNK